MSLLLVFCCFVIGGDGGDSVFVLVVVAVAMAMVQQVLCGLADTATHGELFVKTVVAHDPPS